MTATEKDPEALTEWEGESSSPDGGSGETKQTKPVDTVHNDEALKVLANYQGEETWSDEEEKSLRRKVDWKLMPILCITYGLQYYDKGIFQPLVQAVRGGADYPM